MVLRPLQGAGREIGVLLPITFLYDDSFCIHMDTNTN